MEIGLLCRRWSRVGATGSVLVVDPVSSCALLSDPFLFLVWSLHHGGMIHGARQQRSKLVSFFFCFFFFYYYYFFFFFFFVFCFFFTAPWTNRTPRICERRGKKRKRALWSLMKHHEWTQASAGEERGEEAEINRKRGIVGDDEDANVQKMRVWNVGGRRGLRPCPSLVVVRKSARVWSEKTASDIPREREDDDVKPSPSRDGDDDDAIFWRRRGTEGGRRRSRWKCWVLRGNNFEIFKVGDRHLFSVTKTSGYHDYPLLMGLGLHNGTVWWMFAWDDGNQSHCMIRGRDLDGFDVSMSICMCICV
jgi:hypothetical protein